MARVELSQSAVEDLQRLIGSHNLPRDTRERLKRCIAPLSEFPQLGSELAGNWAGFRFILGPWRWLIVVYVFFAGEDRVVVVTIQDGRTSSAATT